MATFLYLLNFSFKPNISNTKKMTTRCVYGDCPCSVGVVSSQDRKITVQMLWLQTDRNDNFTLVHGSYKVFGEFGNLIWQETWRTFLVLFQYETHGIEVCANIVTDKTAQEGGQEWMNLEEGESRADSYNFKKHPQTSPVLCGWVSDLQFKPSTFVSSSIDQVSSYQHRQQ